MGNPPDEIAHVTAMWFPLSSGLGNVTDPFFIEHGRYLDHPRRTRAAHCRLSSKNRFGISPGVYRERVLGLGGGDRR